MRIEELRFERYAAFTDRALTFRPDARLHIVLGANEAGKTSALSGIGDLLFGFGKRTAYDFLHESRTLRIGARLRLAGGAALSFRRRKGDKNTLLDEAGKPLDDDLLTPLLGAATRESFFAEFGLTARALREGGQELLKAGGRLAETLAASSAQLSALSRLRARLDAEAEALFGARRAASKEFYIADARFDNAEKLLRDAIVTADALKAADEAVEEARRKCDDLRGAHEEIGRALALRRRATRTRPRLLRLAATSEELADFADLPPVAAEETARWRAAWKDAETLDEKLAAYAADDAEDRATIAALAVDETLLAQDAEAQKLRERLGAVRKAQSDLPKRQSEQRIAGDALTETARRLGFASFEQLLARMPTDPALAAAREAVDDRRRAEERCADALGELERARQKQRELEGAEENGTYVADPEPFSRRLEAFAEVAGDADRLRRDRAQDALEEARIAEDAARLDPPANALDELARRPLPDEGAIETARATAADIAEKEKRSTADIAASRATLAAIESEIERHSRAGAAATRDDLLAARARRDAAAMALESSLDSAPSERLENFGKLRAETREIDTVTDVLLSDADRASRLETARERRAQEQSKLSDLLEAQAALDERKSAAHAAWIKLWSRSGVVPRAPAAMAHWITQIGELTERRRRLSDRGCEAAAIESKLAAHRGALARLVLDLGGVDDPSMPIELLHKDAAGRLARLQRLWTGARERAIRRQHAEEEVERREAAKARALETRETARAQWPARMSAIGLAADATIAEAEAALAIWRDVPVQKKDFEELSRRISRMEEDMAAFAADVARLVAATTPDIDSSAPLAALDAIIARLETARKMHSRRDALTAAIDKREVARASLMTQKARIDTILERARLALGLDASTSLATALPRLERRQEVAKEIEIIRRDLVEIGDGYDEETLRAEQDGLDADLLPTEIERLSVDQSQLLADIEAAAKLRHEAEATRERLAAGRDAEAAAHEKAEAGAELLSVSERWITRAAAARLAARAIERHRAAVQDPLILRASALFALATAGAFTGLCVDYDEGDAPTLAGLRPDGVRVPVAGMSEGARDQLFLSLRLSLLELREAQPLPFIGDDLLASFDEARVACALGLLAEFGRARQAILFTHHRHVADIARDTLRDAADVVML
ncbi:hypothetical protein MSC49_20510 [Methylosinus sp. C49]|uniref:ATP-binding protein n=1 Tax=Methylosinus sp. C49 TaxID=2699395 RepID=UPI001367660D|nr:YhaN family protein [Methylosinus sp. C49]BBU62116.1 hypothetical protein MSC49_20510 [Methylosinus sp. C49]